MSRPPRYVGMDEETVWPHWDCAHCDALNPGVEQCNPHYGGAVYCDECGGELTYDFDAAGEVGWCPAFLDFPEPITREVRSNEF